MPKIHLTITDTGILCPIHNDHTLPSQTGLVEHVVDVIMDIPKKSRQCCFCSTEFTTKNNSKRVRVTIHTEVHLNDVDAYKCEVAGCGKGFRSRQDIEKHDETCHLDVERILRSHLSEITIWKDIWNWSTYNQNRVQSIARSVERLSYQGTYLFTGKNDVRRGQRNYYTSALSVLTMLLRRFTH